MAPEKNRSTRHPSGREQPKRLSPEQRQMILALSIGLFMGLLLAWLAGFWMWIPAGLSVGLATGAIMKPPADKN